MSTTCHVHDMPCPRNTMSTAWHARHRGPGAFDGDPRRRAERITGPGNAGRVPEAGARFLKAACARCLNQGIDFWLLKIWRRPWTWYVVDMAHLGPDAPCWLAVHYGSGIMAAGGCAVSRRISGRMLRGATAAPNEIFATKLQTFSKQECLLLIRGGCCAASRPHCRARGRRRVRGGAAAEGPPQRGRQTAPEP